MGRLDFFSDISLTCHVHNKSDHRVRVPLRSLNHHIIASLHRNAKAKTFWKFNNLLLRDKEFTKINKNSIGEVKGQYAATPYKPESVDTIPGELYCSTINPALFYEMLLLEIRQNQFFKASALKKERNSETRELERALKTLSENKQKSSKEFIMTKEQLENIRAKTMGGMFIRSKARWIGEGEKNISIFMQSEKEAFHVEENNKSDHGQWDRNE